ncbi:hypothetical protein CRYUN_Cryun22dG0045000 [Craigia yunnanensis]
MTFELSSGDSKPGDTDDGNSIDHQMLGRDFDSSKVVNHDTIVSIVQKVQTFSSKKETIGSNPEDYDTDVGDITTNKQVAKRCFLNVVLPLLCYYQHESSEFPVGI